MANETQDVELRIRATNYTKKTTTEAVAALKELTKAEEAQIEASKKGAASAADLEKGYGKIESAVKALLGQQSLIKLFKSQTETLDELNAKLEAARKEQADYAASLDPATKRTAAQEATLRKLGLAVASVEKQIGRAESRIQTTSQRLAEFGINSGNLAEKQKEIVEAVTEANAALARQDEAIANAPGFAARAAANERLIEQRHRQVQADVAFEQAQRRLAQSLEQERQAQAALMAERQHNADIIFSNAQRQQAEQINRTTAALNLQRAALNDAADAAERMMRNSAATARGSAPVTQQTVAQRVADVQNPNEAALRSTTALESALGDLESRVRAINGPVRDYRQTLQAAQQAQEALGNMATLLDSYNRQIAAVRAARQEYVQARTAVNALIAEMRSGAAGEDVTSRLARAQTVLERTSTNLGNVTTAARQTQQQLRAAGVDTANLAQAEAQLVAQAGRATTAMNALTEAYRRNGAAAENSGRSIFNWFGGGNGARTTLSYTQRLRGELLSLAAGFVGINAAIGLAQKTLDAYNTNQAIMSRLTVATAGDTAKATEEFTWLQQAADRIGFSFAKVAPAYAKFAIAAQTAGWNTQQVRFAFEQVAIAGTRARLSTDELEGVFKALEQMISKGTIQAEELRGQLGDRLPGAFQIAAKSIGVTVEELGKMMEQGQVSSDRVLNIARELGKTYGAVGTSAETLNQAQARFDNATQRFLNNVANGGFVEAYQGLLNRLTTFLNDGSADKLATNISQGFVLVIDILQKVAENIDLVKFAIEALIALKFLSWLSAIPGLAKTAWIEIGVLAGVIGKAGQAVTAYGAAMTLAGTLSGGFAGTLMTRVAPAIAAVGTALSGLAAALPALAAGLAAYAATTAIRNAVVERMDNDVRDVVKKAVGARNKAFEEADAALLDLQKKKGTEEEKAAQAKYDRLRKIAVDAINAENAAVKKAREDNVDLSSIKFAGKSDTTGGTGKTGATEDPGDIDSSKRQLEALRKELEKEKKKIDRQAENEALKAAKGDLAARLQLIDQEFDEKREKARATFKNAEDLEKALQLIQTQSLAKQAVERAKYNNEQAKKDKTAGDQRKVLAADIGDQLRDLGAKLNKDLAEQMSFATPIEEQLAAAVAAVNKTFAEIEKKIRRFALVDPKGAAEATAALAPLKAQATQIAETNTYRAEANRLTEEFVKQQKIAQIEIGSIQQQVQDGQISLEDGNAKINETIARFGPGIANAGDAALRFAMQFQSMLDPVKFAEIIATIQSGLAKSNVDQQTAANNAITAQKMLNDLLAEEQRERDAIAQQRALGAITSEQEAEALNAVTEKYGANLLQLAQQLQMFTDIARENRALNSEELGKMQAQAQGVITSVQQAHKEVGDLGKTIQSSIASNGTNAFASMAESIAKVINGQQSISQGFKGMMQAAAAFFAQVLMDIAKYIIELQIVNALKAFMGGAAGGAAPAPGMHTGGIVGSNRTFTRKVNPAIFEGAQRFHGGGLPGLKSDEVPTILQKGEEVLSKGSPRNILNGGAAAGGGGGEGAGMRVVLVDDRSRVPQAMASAEGEKVIVQAIKANSATVKALLK